MRARADRGLDGRAPAPNGPTVATSTSPRSTSARTDSGRSTSATAHSSPPSSSASARTRSSLRPASTGRAPRSTSLLTVRSPVYPVAPKTTIRSATTDDTTVRRPPVLRSPDHDDGGLLRRGLGRVSVLGCDAGPPASLVGRALAVIGRGF